MITVTIMKKKQKMQKSLVGIFKNMSGNIPGGNFPGVNSSGGSLIGGNLPGGSFLDTSRNI